MTNSESHLEGKGMNLVEIHKKMVAHRERSGVVAPTLGNVRLALKGKTYKRGLAESRGRKRKLSTTNVRALDKVRKSLIRTKRTVLPRCIGITSCGRRGCPRLTSPRLPGP